MGDTGEKGWDSTVDPEWAAMVDHAERHRDHGFGPIADKLKAGGPPQRLRGTPLIVDTDIGGDPDDAIALICAAVAVPELALVITSDEHDGDRARFARFLLDLLDRRDVPVVRGAQLSDTRYWVADGLVPDTIDPQPDDVVAAVAALCAHTDGPIRWVGMGPLTNLAKVLEANPALRSQLHIIQTGGAINYRDPSRASHNFRLDPDAAITVVNQATNLRLVISDITTNPAIAIRPGDEFCSRLDTPAAPAWAEVVNQHLHRWFTTFTPISHQHDPLTLTAALRLPFVSFSRRNRFRIESDARMFLDPDGHNHWTAVRADYPAFMIWLDKQLTW